MAEEFELVEADHLNDYGIDMRQIVVGTVVRFPPFRGKTEVGRVVRMDRPRLGRAEILDEAGQPTGDRAIFHSANVEAILDSAPYPEQPEARDV